jgi:hypothetical protein
MAKRKREVVDDLLDALIWMRRKAKKREAVDDLVDALMEMRRKTKKKLAVRKRRTKRKSSWGTRPDPAKHAERLLRISAIQSKRLSEHDISVTGGRLCTGLSTEIGDGVQAALN